MAKPVFLSRRPHGDAADQYPDETPDARHPVTDEGGGREDCPHCGASLERGDDGYCNSCGQWWPASVNSVWIPCDRADCDQNTPPGMEERKAGPGRMLTTSDLDDLAPWDAVEDHTNRELAKHGHEPLTKAVEPGAELPTISTVQHLSDFVRQHVESGTPLYVRHSHGPENDAKRGWVSMNYGSGNPEDGLSVHSMYDPRDTWGDAESLAKRGQHDLIEYHPYSMESALSLYDKTPQQVTYLAHGDRVMLSGATKYHPDEPDYEAEGGDGEPLIHNVKPVAYVHPALVDMARAGNMCKEPVTGGHLQTAEILKAIDKKAGAAQGAFDFELHHPPIQLGHIPNPDLKSYDYILVNSSGGKDSQAMLGHVVDKAKKAGVLDRVHVVHADLGRVEWKGTRDIAQKQAEHYGLPFHVVSRPQGDLLDQVLHRHEQLRAKGDTTTPAWPSSTTRYCTSDHKRAQIRKVMTYLADQHRQHLADTGQEHRPARILNCMGLRAAESPARSKKLPFEHNPDASTKTTRHVDDWLPIHHWNQEQVWDKSFRNV